MQPGELKNLIKDVGKIKDRDLIQKSKAPLSDDQLRKQSIDEYKKSYERAREEEERAKKRQEEEGRAKKSYEINQAPSLFDLMKHTLPSRTLPSAGSFLNGGAQDKQTIAVDNTVRLIIKDKEIILSNDNSTNDKKNIFYAETRLT